MIKLDINIGDIILVGRFKNKRIEVKEFGIDEHGLPTINGRSILKIRIEKLMKTKKNLKEGKWNHDAVGRSGPISVYRDGTESVKFYMENDKWMYSVTKPNGDQAPGFSFGKSAGTVDAQYSKYFDNGNIRGMTVAAKKILKEGMIHESKQFNLMNIVKKILKEDHTNRPGKHFKNIRNLDYDVDTQDGVKIAKYIDKENYFKHKNLLPGGYPFNVDKLNSINKENSNIISVSGVYVDNRAFSRAFKKQELEKILNKKLNYIDPDRKIKENMKKQIKESIDYDETEVNPSFLIQDNEYV